MALKRQVTSSPTPLTVALPASVIVKCRSSVPFGACGAALAPVLASAMPPATATSRPDCPVARTTSVEPAGTDTAAVLRACDGSPGRRPGRIIGGRPV